MDNEYQRREAERVRRERREASDRSRKSQDKGRYFHYGMAELRSQTRENGWKHEDSVKLPSGRTRRHDTARSVSGREFFEYKAGDRVGGEFVAEQISKEREVLRNDPEARGAWVAKQGALDRDTRRELEALAREFPGRFRVEEISKEEADRAIALGKKLEKEQERNQPELFNSSRLRSQERAREREKEIREKQQVREAAQRAMEKEERERQIREAQQKQREAAQRVAEYARQDREAAARGEKVPMTGREAADILAVSRPTPGVKSPHRTPPRIERNRGGRERPGRERGQERER